MPSPESTLHVRRDLLDRPVREYAENLQEQILVVLRSCNVKDMQGFEQLVRERKVPEKLVEQMKDLMQQLRSAVQKNEVPINQERFERGKEMFDQALGILKEIHDSYLRARAAVDVAKEYRASDAPPSEQFISFLSNAAYERPLDPLYQIESLLALALEERAAGRDPHPFFERALGISDLVSGSFNIFVMRLQIAERAYAAGDALWMKAIDLARDITLRSANTSELMGQLNMLAELEIKLKADPSKTFTAYKAAIVGLQEDMRAEPYADLALLEQAAGWNSEHEIQAVDEFLEKYQGADYNYVTANIQSKRAALAAHRGEDPVPHFEAALKAVLTTENSSLRTERLEYLVRDEIAAKQYVLAEKHCDFIHDDYSVYANSFYTIAHAMRENGLPSEAVLKKAWDAARSVLLTPELRASLCLSIVEDRMRGGLEFRSLLNATQQEVKGVSASNETECITLLARFAVLLGRARDPAAESVFKTAYDVADKVYGNDTRAEIFSELARIFAQGGQDELAKNAIEEAREYRPMLIGDLGEQQNENHRLWNLARATARCGAEMIRGARHQKNKGS